MRCALVSVLPCRQIATSRYQLQLPHQSISFDHPHPSSSCSYFSNPLSRNTRTTVESRQASPGANLRRYFHSDCDPSLTQYGVRSEKFRLALRNSFVRYCLPIQVRHFLCRPTAYTKQLPRQAWLTTIRCAVQTCRAVYTLQWLLLCADDIMVFLYASLLRTNPVDYNIGKTANLPSPTYDRLALFLRQHNMCLRVFMFSSSFLSFFLFSFFVF